MEDCIFCKIVKGEIPSSRVYEDEKTLAFLDIAPVQKGHTLVITKNHYETIADIPEEELKELITAVKKVSKAVKKGANADGFVVSMNNGKASGQEVPHAHFHIIPRFNQDGLKPWPKVEYKGDEIEDYKENISQNIE
jgi:histidine triad (HIT) family protein